MTLVDPASVPPEERDGLPSEARTIAVVVVATGTVMSVLDSSIATIALPTLARELHAGPSASIWVVNAYQLVMVVLLLPLASLGDMVGYRRVYALGIALFTAGSLACALAHTLPLLIAARVLQACGGAGVMAVAPALYREIFPSRLLGTALGISAVTVASSSAAGPTIGGAILAIAPWPWLFAINVPIGIVVASLAGRALPPGSPRGGRLDVPSALLAGPALAIAVYALDGLGRGTTTLETTALFALAVVMLVVFVRRQRRLADPMLAIRLFAIPRFSLAAGTSLGSFVAQGLSFVALPFLFQNVYGYSAFVSGLLFTPWPAAIAAIAPLAGRLADTIPPPRLATIGLGIFALGLASLATLGAHASILDIVWRNVLCGAGFGFFQSPNNRELLGSAPRRDSGSASGILASVRVFGQSTGAAVVAIALGVTTAARARGDVHAAAAVSGPVHVTLWIAAGMAAVATAVSALRLRPASPGGTDVAPERLVTSD